MKPVLASASALMLLACSSPQQAEASDPDATYVCAGGRTFSVTYDEGYTVATVRANGATYKLPAVISGSGARYSDGKVEFWEHQGEAMLNGAPGGDTGSCPRKELD